MFKKFVVVICLFSIISTSVFCEDHTAEPIDKEELPQAVQDIRRFEIITLGSMPFVLLDTTLVYSGIKVGTGARNSNGEAYKVTPFATSSCFTWEEDQKKILTITACVCVGIGITDLIVRLVKRSSKNKKIKNTKTNDISIIPLSEDPDATPIKLQKDDDFEIEEDGIVELNEESIEIESSFKIEGE